MTASRSAARALHLAPSDIHDWAMQEFRSTSPWAVGQALAALGRHHARPWLGRIDVPTAVVVTTGDHVIPPSRQVALARAIPGATMHEVDAGHASCVMQAERFVPVMVQAASTVAARRRDFGRHAPVEEPQQA
jgi:pimeloyl-ACP methyl ester carboxylesterase